MAKKMIGLLHSEADYEAAVDEIERYFDSEPTPGTPQADHFDLLALVIEDYERRHWPVDAPNPIDAIRYRMQTGGYSQADLGRLLGSRQRASDILARKRPLTLDMVWKLHREWKIPAEALIRPQNPARPRGGTSSAVAAVDYKRSKRQLFVTFASGKTHVYHDVPSEVYEQFVAAGSKGRFFNTQIRDQYRYASPGAMATRPAHRRSGRSA
jgi:HTH-type transcriptional regulator/antitoxin HigA